MGGKHGQQFVIGSGANFNGASNIWLEIAYRVNDAQIFYTRNYLHQEWPIEEDAGIGDLNLDKFVNGETDSYGFGDMLPETGFSIKRKKYSSPTIEGEDCEDKDCDLEISADVGAVFGMASPGTRSINIRLNYVPLEDGVQFMRDLTHEIAAAQRGEHPDPGNLPVSASEWSFTRQLNQQAYNLISEDYQEHYFSNKLFATMFDKWLAELPANGHILDAGCGHGDPIITRLIDKGFHVSGIDLSPAMLQRARKKYPEITFSLITISELEAQGEYDGACSLSSMLYLDPIDLYHSIYRLYQALKPGGLLFLFAYDLHPDWRGLPLINEIKQWMWSWTYSMAEAAHALEEHSYFKILESKNVTTQEEEKQLVDEWRKFKQKQYEETVKKYYSQREPPPAPDLTKIPDDLSYCYVLIARRQDSK